MIPGIKEHLYRLSMGSTSASLGGWSLGLESLGFGVSGNDSEAVRASIGSRNTQTPSQKP